MSIHVFRCTTIAVHSRDGATTAGYLSLHCNRLLSRLGAHDQYPLVDRRCRDLIQWVRADSAYRIARPTLMNGGPSPRMRALASQDRLPRRRPAASFGVSRRSMPALVLFVGMVMTMFAQMSRRCADDWRITSSFRVGSPIRRATFSTLIPRVARLRSTSHRQDQRSTTIFPCAKSG
jgi:hypothetical protein